MIFNLNKRINMPIKKKSLFVLSAFVLSFGAHAAAQTENYNLTLSPDGNTYIFTKTNTDVLSYHLDKTSTDKGTAFNFLPNTEPTPGPVPDPEPLQPTTMWKDTNQWSSKTNTVESGKLICENLTDKGRNWHLPSFDELQQAVDTKDVGAVAAYKPIEGMPNIMLINTPTKDLPYFNDFPVDLRLNMQTNAIGLFTPRVICVSNK